MTMTPAQHRARRAAESSMRNVKAKDKSAWLALSADDAVVEDPVGASPLDPSGQGHRVEKVAAQLTAALGGGAASR